ncbi:MAG: hypothetical protein ACF8XB_02650 [Planctomycetota bacterium JB042]
MNLDESLDQRVQELRSALPPHLAAGTGPVAVARAPGCLDVLGGAVRFAGGTWVSWPMRAGVTVAIRSVDGPALDLSSRGRADRAQAERAVWPLADVEGIVDASGERALAERLRADRTTAWSERVVLALRRIFRLVGRPLPGLAVDVRSDLPEGCGFGSSTALGAATARAAAAWLGLEGKGWIEEVAAVDRVGDPLAEPSDAFAVCDGVAGRFLPFLAQPCEPLDPIAPPPDVEPVALDLGGRVAAPPRLRTAAAMAYRIMAARMGLTVATRERGEAQEVDDPFYGGWLANCDPVTFTNEFRDALPERQAGEAFLDAYGGLADAAVRVDPDVEYPVREAAGFVLTEHQRACRFVDELHRTSGVEGASGESLGALLRASESEARRLERVPRRAAELVDALDRRGPDRGVLGARSTGPGGVVALVRRGDASERALQEAVAEWERNCGRSATLLRGGSGGAAGADAATVVTIP